MKKILMCGGGSAGHVVPNIALYRDLKENYIVEYAGTNGIERGICGREGLKYYTFNSVKLVRGKILSNIALPVKLLKAVRQAEQILNESSPDAVFCKGGYASLPPALAARKKKIPIFTHESDLSAGLANKIISKLSVYTFTSFPETAKKFKNGIYTGSPLRQEILNMDKNVAKEKFGLDERKTILVFGGGSGSEIINQSLRKIITELCNSFNVLHICGKGNIVNNNIYGYKQFEFISDMGYAYAAADCAVARCGSNSAFEIIANRIPALFIPLENKASRGDQLLNAEYFYKNGLCRVLRQRELTPEKLSEEIGLTISDKALKEALADSKIVSGNTKIIAEIAKIIGN